MAQRTRRQRRAKGTGELFRNREGGPWIARWYTHDGKRPERSTRTTDRQAAERILAKYMADEALRRDGVIDADQDRYATEGRRLLSAHAAEYLAHCKRVGLDDEHIASKERHLGKITEAAGVTRLNELTPDTLERYLSTIKDAGKSARSVNFARQILVTFMAWAVKTGRVPANTLKVVPKQDETRDRRRVRRPLTDDELSRLLVVARERGREAWYLAAALAGLRKGDMQRLTWGDVNFSEGTLTLRHGKAKRIDVVPMHPQLAEALQRHRKAKPAMPTVRVWTDTVGNVTRVKDFLRAGIAKRVPVLDNEGRPVMVGEGENARPKTRISTEDDQGRVVDLHALRTTLGTQLARAGVAPQVAQKIMRHSDYTTTLRHYTVLGLHDTSAAVAKLPSIRTPEKQSQLATGTCDRPAQTRPPVVPPSKREMGRSRATSRDFDEGGLNTTDASETACFAAQSDVAQRGAKVERRRLELPTPSLQS